MDRQDDLNSGDRDRRLSELEEGVVFTRVREGTSIDEICADLGLSRDAVWDVLDRVMLRLGILGTTGPDFPFAMDPRYTHHLHQVAMDEAALLGHLRTKHGYTRPADSSSPEVLRAFHEFVHRRPPPKPA